MLFLNKTIVGAKWRAPLRRSLAFLSAAPFTVALPLPPSTVIKVASTLLVPYCLGQLLLGPCVYFRYFRIVSRGQLLFGSRMKNETKVTEKLAIIC